MTEARDYSLNMSLLDEVDARKARILSRVPEADHAAVNQEARYIQNSIGGRYTDCLDSAVQAYLTKSMGSPLAKSLLAK
jgi:hypothetical protein